MPLGISSVYYSKSIVDGGRLLDELAALGFDGVELEYRIRPETLRDMGRRPGRDIPVFSVHAFFPNPAAGGEGSGANAFLFSAPDRDERGAAVRHGLATLEVAERLGARAVVLHLGRVPVGQELFAEYRRLASAADGPASPELRAAVAAVLEDRERLRAPHVDAALRSVDRLNREAVRRGLLLGVENRYHPHEIPSHEETGLLLREFAGGAVRCWHDVGHALNLERLGVGTQRQWLESYGAQLAGTHLHDIRGGDDHLAPGTGEADFAALLRHLPAGAIRILEIRPEVSREQVLAARDRLRALGY